MKKTALFITALFGASLANAHNVWLEPVKDAKGQYVVKFGHEETETYPQSKLKAVRLLDAKGQLQNATVNFQEGEAHFAAPDAAIALFALIMVFGQNYQAVNMSKKPNNRHLMLYLVLIRLNSVKRFYTGIHKRINHTTWSMN